MEALQSLLAEVQKITSSDKQHKEEARSRGERFNVFNELRLWSEEVQLHSRFLAALLYPQGNHGMKDAFLKAFIKQVGIDDLKIDTTECTVDVEFYVGQVTDKEGGRIDILIHDKNKSIIIENKIYAGDQPNQMLRYYNYGENKYKNNYKLLYLTLDGHEPSEDSTNNELANDKYICISYEKTIIYWLYDCVKLAYDKPLVRETINQYITLLKQLTNQDMETSSKENIIKEISRSSDTFISAGRIYNNYIDAANEIIQTHFKKHLSKLCSDIGTVSIDDPLCSNNNYAGFKIEIAKWNYFKTAFEFEKKNCNELCYGILSKDNNNNNNNGNYKNSIKNLNTLKGFNANNLWHCWRYTDQYNNWNEDVFAEMFNENSNLYKYIVSCITELIELTNDFDM